MCDPSSEVIIISDEDDDYSNDNKTPISYESFIPRRGCQCPRTATIFFEDFHHLDRGGFFNDDLIEFGLSMLYERFLASRHSNHKIGMMSTFFYRKYITKGYSSVAAWADHLYLPALGVLVVPICKTKHWYTILVLQAGQYDSHFCVIALDSLGYARLAEQDKVEEWFLTEYKSCFPGFTPTRCASVDIPVPLQPNWFDCGPYMVHNVDRAIHNLDLISSMLMTSQSVLQKEKGEDM
ncbi:hypothetical protein M422DRAFT_242684 [Sphaerobolus stellatus SS14]|nr:hypothetical protein M422DRAFT_242684 [Sphaerobolus stellatus SS14]